MVYDKKRSGDPDYDDKVPADQHALTMTKSADGRDVILSEVTGPTFLDGTHANLEEPADAEDNRPKPGEVATEASGVQTYEPADTPTENVSAGDVEKVLGNEERENAGLGAAARKAGARQQAKPTPTTK